MRLEPANIVCPRCKNPNYMRHLIGKGVGKLDMKCINCNSYFSFDELYKQKIAEVIKPQTHFDRIRNMTVEEMAKTAADYVSCHYCPIPFCKVRFTMERIGCIENWLDYLKQEVTTNSTT